MFNSLTGTITGKFPNTIYLDTHGIEWDLFVSESTIENLPPVGQTSKIYTWLYHSDNLMKLYGFATKEERDLFLELLKVDGIGAKGAVKILSNISGVQLIAALDAGDVAALERVPGLGKKTAAKMMLTLKGKLTLVDTSNVEQSRLSSVGQPYAAVAASLSNMGYDKRECEQTIERLSMELLQDKSFVSLTQSEQEDTLFRRAIVELSQ